MSTLTFNISPTEFLRPLTMPKQFEITTQGFLLVFHGLLLNEDYLYTFIPFISIIHTAYIFLNYAYVLGVLV